MHEPAGPSTLPLAESVNPSVAPASSADMISRPKIMRRPATFSAAAHNNPLPFELLKISPVVEHVASTHLRPWQDDGRFGMTLLAIVVVINLVLALAIPTPQRSNTAFEEKVTVITESGNFMPAANTAAHAPVTTYAQPEDSRRSGQFFDLQQMSPTQNVLDVSPHDVPAPNAQALDQPSPSEQ